MKQYDLLVIGFGKAGKTLAATFGKEGKKVALIEQDPAMYGWYMYQHRMYPYKNDDCWCG